MTKAYERLLKCYQCFKDKINFKPEVALVLGSGLGDYADTIRVEAVLDYHDIEGFLCPQSADIRADLSLDT